MGDFLYVNTNLAVCLVKFFRRNGMLTLERARKYLRFEPIEGKLYWRRSERRARAGREAGGIQQRSTLKYRLVRIDGKGYLAHRLIWFLTFGTWPKEEIDHWNGNGLDNRLSNLREVTHQENNQNKRMRADNTSGVTGVYWEKQIQKWRAQIGVAGGKIHLGYFNNLQDAAAAREKANTKYGFTARHGKER